MDRLLAQARKEARSWMVAGLLSFGAGGSIWYLGPGTWITWLCGAVFGLVGLYLVCSSRPFLSTVEQLLQTDQPCRMELSIRSGSRFVDTDYYVELRFPRSEGASPWDIRVFVSYQPWFDVIRNPLPAKVWGATRLSGPVVVETDHGALLPAGPGAVSRRQTA
jgi:hypothetical protein